MIEVKRKFFDKSTIVITLKSETAKEFACQPDVCPLHDALNKFFKNPKNFYVWDS